MIGDGVDPNTMDIIKIENNSNTYWLSILFTKLKEIHGVAVEVLDWSDEKIDWSKKKMILIGPIWDYH
jgi:hypothetical protein